MSSENYVDWCAVSNTVKSRLKDKSLAHTFTSERKIRKSTKLINTTLEQKLCKTTYTQFKQCKQKILNQLTENSDILDKSDINDNYYKAYYDSFDTSLTNIQPEVYFWHNVDKKYVEEDESDDESEDLEPLSIWEPKVDISIIQPNENFKKLYISKSKRKEQVTKSSSTIRNKEVSSANSKVIIRKNVSTKEKQSPKLKLLSNKSLKSVKKNLTSALDNANLGSEDVPGEEWNEDFAAAEFQAQSTQIFSDTFSEKKPNTRFSVNHRSSRDIIHQPRDSGIEEDSREDNIKCENLAGKISKDKNTDNLKLDNNEIKKSPNKKVPLKIIGEEMVTKKFKIINNKNKETKPIEEEKKEELLKTELTKGDIQARPTNKNLESSSESDSEFLDCHNPDDSQCNQSDKGSSEEYSSLQDDNNKEDSQENAQEHENKKTESDNSSDNESIVYKRQLQEELKRCKSPFMIRRYQELKRSGVLDESDTESQIKLTEDIKKKPKRILITPSKTNKKDARKNFKTPSPQSIPKTQKQVKYDESFEDKTLVAENFNGSLMTNGLEDNEYDVEANEVEATPNIAKLHQIKKLSLLADNSESEDSQDENICKKAEDKTMQKRSCMSPEKIKIYHQEIKRTNKQSTYEDSDKSENGNKYNTVKESLNSNTLSTQVKETVSLKKGRLNVNTSKSNKDYSDSIVSETTNSLSSSKSKKGQKKKEKSKELEKLADKNNLSADEESAEISAQSDLENVVDNYKQRLASPIPKLAEDFNESDEPTDIGTQFQSMESPDHEDSDDLENSVQEKTVIHLKNKNKIHSETNTDSDSEKKDDSLKNESCKDNKIKQKAAAEESSSEEDTTYLEEMRDDAFDANKNEESENEMSSKSKENLKKIKRLDLLNSDEDSEDSKDGIIDKNHCNSDVDIEEHKIVDILSCDDSKKKDNESLNHLKSSNDDSSDNSEIEITSASKSVKSKTKHLSSASLKNSKIYVPDIDDNNSNSSEKKGKRKRKLEKIDSVHESDRESGTSQEIDVVHFSSENDANDHREIKKSKSSNFGTSPIAEEENIDTLSPNRFNHTKISTVTSENGNNDSDSDPDMSYSSKQKILRLKKMNLLANNDSSSSEDEETIKNSQNKFMADNRNEAANKNPVLSDADSNSDSEKKKDLHDSNVTINKKKNQVKENGDLKGENDESDIEDQKDNIFDNKNSESKDSEEECTMSSKTKERLNKMKRLDLLNSDEDSDNSESSINDKNKNNNSDVDIEEHKIEDLVSHHALKKNNETKGQEISSDSDSEKNETFKSREKLKVEGEKKNEIKIKETLKITSKMLAINDAEVNNSFEEEKGEIKENKKSKNKVIIQETQENVNSQKSILESQPMFSSLEDLREGLVEEQLNIDVESDVNANTLKDTNQIPPTEDTIKKFMDKITKISELVEKESLEKINCQSTMTVNDISPDEDIFMLEVPKTIFNENLIGKKFSFLKTTLTVGNNKFEAFQKHVSPTYSCILKTEKKALDSFTTQNIRPSATIVARRKKFVGESNKITDNEMDEDIQESSTVSDTENFENGTISSKDKNTKIKVTKKGSKTLKKSEEKEVLNLPVKKNKEGSKKVKSNKDIFNIKNFVMKTKTTTLDNLEKRNKKKHKKEHVSTNNPLNHDEISKEENLHNNLSDYLEETRTQTKVKKAPIKEAVNITPSKGAIPKKPVKNLSKSKKVKPRTEDVEETESVKVTNKKTNAEAVKKSDSKPRLKKRKAEIQTSVDANPDEKQETKKKKKVAAEQKEKKPASKATNSRKLKKKGVDQTGESAAEQIKQIKKLIAKNIKFDDSLNGSFDPSSYKPLDIERVPKKPKRCQSTTSNSSDDENQFTRRSFHVRVKAKPEDDKSTNACSSVDVKNEDKKSVKKVFFAE